MNTIEFNIMLFEAILCFVIGLISMLLVNTYTLHKFGWSWRLVKGKISEDKLRNKQIQKEEKLMVQVGKDKQDNPIYKEVKKLIFVHIDENKVVSYNKVKPFFNGQIWLFYALNRLFSLDKTSVFFDKKLNFYVLGFCEKNVVEGILNGRK